MLRLVAKRGPHLAHAVVNAFLEVDVPRVAPERPPDLVVRDDVAGTGGKQREQRRWLRLEADGGTGAPQFATRRVERTIAEETTDRRHGHVDERRMPRVPSAASGVPGYCAGRGAGGLCSSIENPRFGMNTWA